MSRYDSVRDLPLVVESYDLDGHEYVVGPEFTRKTTVVRLAGGGEEGLGEDVTYDGGEQDAQQARGPVLPLAGEWTIDTFSRHLETLPLFEKDPERHAYADYRRWAFESAALDLALRQAGRSLGEAVGREADLSRSSPPEAWATRPRRIGSAPSSASTPRCASSSTHDRTGRMRSSTSSESSAASTRSTSRASTPARSSTTRPTRSSIAA